MILGGLKANPLLEDAERELCIEAAFEPPEEHRLVEESLDRDILRRESEVDLGAPSRDDQSELVAPEPDALKDLELAETPSVDFERELAMEMAPPPTPAEPELAIPEEMIELPPVAAAPAGGEGVTTELVVARFEPGITTGLGPGCIDRRGSPELRLRSAKSFGGGQDTERAVERALSWLAAHQRSNGTWEVTAGSSGTPAEDRTQLATHGVATLAFLGAGYNHMKGKHHRVLGRALNWLITQQQTHGGWCRAAGSQEMHAQGIAALALAEALMSCKEAGASRGLRRAAEKSIGFVQRGQCPNSAWGYLPGDTHIEQSCVIWNGMALKAAKTAGLRVGGQSFAGMARWLDDGQAAGGKYSYSGTYDPASRRTKGDGGNGSACMVAAAIMMRFWTGTKPGERSTFASGDFVLKAIRAQAAAASVAGAGGGGVGGGGAAAMSAPGTASPPDLYFLHHGTIAMFQLGGRHWRNWNTLMKKMVLHSQYRDGHWDPSGHSPNTTMATGLGALVLESYYRYSPLYRKAPLPKEDKPPVSGDKKH